jgi:murein DD-endopeptidase MepM/ murein hydrolase activator NlpD
MICFYETICDHFPNPDTDMKRTFFLFILLLTSFPAVLSAENPDADHNVLLSMPESNLHRNSASQASISYNDLNSRIRDGKISKSDARTELVQRLAAVRKDYYLQGGKDYTKAEWVFPLAGYGMKAIDGGRSHGFVPGGYDFFSGNRHGGHPAYDIFIRDRNQDNHDDRTGKPVRVLSMTGGMVVALEREWEGSSKLRGGKYLWIYDPANDLLIYYAHNDELLVQLGDIVKPGDDLATVGRSGLNAAKRRSPTHLHFSVLGLADGKPLPLNVYTSLQQSRLVAAQ